jgi:L-alanine-DL-glutamate epimerase-like enolase superfamily enzyme
MQSDVSIRNVDYNLEDFSYRAPMKFGGIAVDRVTLLHVTVTVRTRSGEECVGFGSMPMGNIWAFPSRVMTYEQTLGAMKELGGSVAELLARYPECGHPVDINHDLEPLYVEAAGHLSRKRQLAEPIPKLAALVVASAFDAAVHDGFAKANRINCYLGYSSQYMRRDASAYLDARFAGQYLDECLLPAPRPSMPLYHLVGALDPITDADLSQRLGDGLPETLGDWIRTDGLTHIKIKLNGDDLLWDIERVIAIDAEARIVRQGEWNYSLDFNERCPDVEYLLEFLARIQERKLDLIDRIQYIEQPTSRDLRSKPENQMHKAARIKPVVIDESLVDYDSLLAARDLGYTGVALKACKGQGNALLMALAAMKFGMFLCVQDLTCPGASLIHSAGLAARVRGVAGIEANARQFVPAANHGWDARFPGIFTIRDGCMATGQLTGPGLGAIESKLTA